MAATENPADSHSPPPSASASTFSRSQTHSVRSARALPSGIRTVVTAPPWARDEPPSPFDEGPTSASKEWLSDHPRPSADIVSFQSSNIDDNAAGPSRWWTFTRHRPDISLTGLSSRRQRPSDEMALRRSQSRDRSKSIPWLPPSLSRRTDDSTSSDKANELGASPTEHEHERRHARFHLDLPAPDPVMTMSHNRTPGWDSPWSPRPPAHLVARITGNRNGDGTIDEEDAESISSPHEKLGRWARRKKKFRAYILNNVYVPLLFRFINITFTTAALAMAIRIRQVEKRNGVMGAVGPSPTLVIIFAPLTLVHVMAAVYLEYFGRPLGLWRTSGKLAHTLSEVVFICAWSAALALCFDNFFTSVIPCASPASSTWYNELPRPPPPPNLSPEEGKTICNEQLALICLVGVGLIMYCYNLVISLFRIFEKVKYHPSSSRPVR